MNAEIIRFLGELEKVDMLDDLLKPLNNIVESTRSGRQPFRPLTSFTVMTRAVANYEPSGFPFYFQTSTYLKQWVANYLGSNHAGETDYMIQNICLYILNWLRGY